MQKWLITLVTLLPLLYPELTSAHSFGKLYNLPVPFWMYLYGGAGALIISFLIIGYFFNKTPLNLKYPIYDLSKVTPFNFLVKKEFLIVLKVTSIVLFLFTIFTGLIGKDISYVNFNMPFFWIIFVLLFAYLTAIIGNVYAVINPWKNIIESLERVLKEKFIGVYNYPKSLSFFPALFFYFLFIWIELFGQTGPLKLSLLLIQYSIINFTGVFLIGKDNWFHYCEFFSVFFRLISKLSPIEYISGRLLLRPPFIGLLKDKPKRLSLLLFILFMLSSTAFDGFKETIIWYNFYANIKETLYPVFGSSSYQIFQTTGLLFSPILFFVIYFVLITFVKIVTREKVKTEELMLQFTYSLIPIALVYNMAHYYTLILTEGQIFIRILSDPFGFGWNLFNTGNFPLNLNLIDAGITWHVQVILILTGHIISVYIAHFIALQAFPSHKKALLSQLPMIFLMVAYTIIGLWILAQPVTGGTF